MNCKNCGNYIGNNSFCSYCGFNNAFGMPQRNKGNVSRIVSLFMILILVLVLLLTLYAKVNYEGTGSRTIMMYIVGSNLETDAAIVTADLAAISPLDVDLKNTNVLIYTGGTKKWHNYIQNDENAIYKLTSEGFKKIESYEKKNMGDSNTLSSFLTYAYKNYPASNYNLILYDHGGAIDGAIYDDFTSDNLNLKDFSTALKNSPFNEKNKLQTVIFRTCLNGTLEVANVFSNYAKYMIASEEITYGSQYSNVLSFLNNIVPKDNGVEVGEKFITRYKKQIEEISSSLNLTYSIIDLSKVSNVIKELNSFVEKINPETNYTNIAKIRAKSFQYGKDEPSYDMIDLYNFVSELSKTNNVDASKLLRAIDEAVVHNETNLENSHGLSIYFPYNGKNIAIGTYLGVYESIQDLKSYDTFIKKFNNLKKNNNNYISFNVSKNKVDISDKKVSIQLNDKQKEDYANAVYVVFMKDKKHPEYYQIVYSSDEVELSNDGKLTANLDKLTKVRDKFDNSSMYMYTKVRHENGSKVITTVGLLEHPINWNKDIMTSFDDYTHTADFYMEEIDTGYNFVRAIQSSKNGRINGTVLKIDDYKYVELLKTERKIFNNGKFITDSEDWETSPVIEGLEIEPKNVELTKVDFDSNEEYYVAFNILDIYNNSYYTNAVKVGN